MKVAQFKSATSASLVMWYHEQEGFNRWAWAQKEYVQLSEWVEVDFPPLQTAAIVEAQIRVLDAAAVEAQQECARRLNELAEARAKLLALTHEPTP